MGEEEISKYIDQMVEHRQTAEHLKLLSQRNLVEVIRSLGKGICLSARTILTICLCCL